MEQWKEVPLEKVNIDIIDGDRGNNYPKQNEFMKSGYCLFLNTSNIKNDSFDFSNSNFINEKKDSLLRKGKLERNDIVITTRGTIGSIAHYNSHCIYDNIRINSGMVIIRAKENIDSKYLYIAFRSNYFKEQCFQRASGSAQPQLPIKDLKTLKIPLPPLPIQQRIASILSAYDDLIENNRRRIALLEESARLLYKEWFVKFKFPGHEKTKFVDGLPEGWERKKLGEVCFENKKVIHPKDIPLNTPYIGLEHMPRRSIALSEWGISSELMSMKLLYVEGDFLFGKIRPYFHKVGITFTNGVTSSDSIVIKPLEEKYRYFTLMLISSDEFIKFASKTVREGSKMPRADWKFLLQYTIVISKDHLLNTFNEHIQPTIKQIKNLVLQTQKLKGARDILLPKLMKGIIKV